MISKQEEITTAIIWEIDKNPKGLSRGEALAGRRFNFTVPGGNVIDIYINSSYIVCLNDLQLNRENSQKVVDKIEAIETNNEVK
jgi:hypothetical protein